MEKINGYLVYKRKKKHVTTELSKSYASSDISPNSGASMGEVYAHIDIPAPAVGKNGCDDAGPFIFCKACRFGYHLQCVSPPLESIPEGNWQCPNCPDDDDLSELIVNFKSSVSKEILTPKKLNNASSRCSICSKGKRKLYLF